MTPFLKVFCCIHIVEEEDKNINNIVKQNLPDHVQDDLVNHLAHHSLGKNDVQKVSHQEIKTDNEPSLQDCNKETSSKKLAIINIIEDFLS